MRISRPCYDKIRRCPGWAGGGIRYAKVHRCDDGRIQIDDNPHWKWRMYRCNTCDVIVLPFMIRYIDPFHWYYDLKYKWRTKARG